MQNRVVYVRPPIVVHAHDVLSGRGVNIAQHPGNERFRSLVQARYDADYCQQYTVTEKRALAEEIIAHIHSLSPPGRFLKRIGRSTRGLGGPWEELSPREAIRKTTQALRDCNRGDRTGYAAAVVAPEDVRESVEHRQMSGLSNKEIAKQMALAATKAEAEEMAAMEQMAALKRSREASISPSIENAAEWLKKQRTEHTPVPNSTPTTAASSGGMLQETSVLESYHGSPANVLTPAVATYYSFDDKGTGLDPLSEAVAALEGGGTLEHAPASPLHAPTQGLEY